MQCVHVGVTLRQQHAECDSMWGAEHCTISIVLLIFTRKHPGAPVTLQPFPALELLAGTASCSASTCALKRSAKSREELERFFHQAHRCLRHTWCHHLCEHTNISPSRQHLYIVYQTITSTIVHIPPRCIQDWDGPVSRLQDAAKRAPETGPLRR